MRRSVRHIIVTIRKRPGLFICLWISMFWLFSYTTALDLFTFIWANPDLTFVDKVRFMFDSLINVLVNLKDPLSLSLLVFSFIASINLILLWRQVKLRSARRTSGASALSGIGGIIGSHCIACGGSLVAPLITSLAGSSAYFSAARIQTAITLSVLINIVAIVIVGIATLKLAERDVNNVMNKQNSISLEIE